MSDALIMLRRNVRHARRNPTALVMTIALPIFLLLIFIGVFGGAMNAGFAHTGYIDYLVPGILLMTVSYGATTTSLAVNRDVTTGIIGRFRTMAISRASVLTGHVLVATGRTLLSACLVIAVSVVLGFRPDAGPVRWLATFGLVTLLTLALTWVGVAVGLAARTAEATAPFTFIVQLLPFFSSAFVPPESMSAPVRWFAVHEPFTPIIDTLRHLMLATPTGADGIVATAWCVGLALFGYGWARALFRRDPR